MLRREAYVQMNYNAAEAVLAEARETFAAHKVGSEARLEQAEAHVDLVYAQVRHTGAEMHQWRDAESAAHAQQTAHVNQALAAIAAAAANAAAAPGGAA